MTGSAITDLNAMTRRARATHRLSHHAVSGSAELVLNGDDCLVFCGEGTVRVGNVTLSPLDCLRLSGCRDQTLLAEGSGRLYLAEFSSI
ncbi:HutD family protein [Paracoccus cavernae]|uniref:HutD family protein n=1 Tax=Paracoccus cavernae TaxID=1571207 RepID=UPI003625F060